MSGPIDLPDDFSIRTNRGLMSVSIDAHGWPHWTRLEQGRDAPSITMDHEAMRLLHYALGRFIAYLDRSSAQ